MTDNQFIWVTVVSPNPPKGDPNYFYYVFGFIVFLIYPDSPFLGPKVDQTLLFNLKQNSFYIVIIRITNNREDIIYLNVLQMRFLLILSSYRLETDVTLTDTFLCQLCFRLFSYFQMINLYIFLVLLDNNPTVYYNLTLSPNMKLFHLSHIHITHKLHLHPSLMSNIPFPTYLALKCAFLFQNHPT